jgi:hypothetical protein
LEIDNYEEDQDGSKQIGHIWKILAVESFTKSTDFISSCNQQMEQCNDSPFKFSATATVDSCGAKRLPDDILTTWQQSYYKPKCNRIAHQQKK